MLSPNPSRDPSASTSVSRAVAALAVALALLAAPAAPAQPLGGDVVGAPTSAAIDTDAIDRYIADHRDGLLSVEDPEAHARAVERLIEPLLRPTVSVAFRNAYGDALEPFLLDLTPATSYGLPQGRITILRLSGALATERSANRVLDAMSSEDAAVRYFAAYSARRLFEAAARTNPAFTPGTAGRLIGALETRVVESTDPGFASAALVALETAGDRDRPPRIEGFPAAARIAMADASRRRVLALSSSAIDEPDELDVLLRAGVAAQESARAGSEAAAREAVGFAGSLLGIVLERLEQRIASDGGGGVNHQSPDARLASLAETVLAVASERDLGNGGSGVAVPEIRAMLIRGDRGVRTEILGLIGRGGRLTEAPYGFEPAALGLSG